MSFDAIFRNVVALDVPDHGSVVFEVRIGAQVARTTASDEGMWDDDELQVNGSFDIDLLEVFILSDMEVISRGTTALDALRAAKDTTKQLYVHLHPEGSVAMAVTIHDIIEDEPVFECPPPISSSVPEQVVDEDDLQVEDDVLDDDDDVQQQQQQEPMENREAIDERFEEVALWPITDAYLTSSIERYVAECERADVKTFALRPYMEMLKSLRGAELEEGPDPASPSERNLRDRAAANYAVSQALTPDIQDDEMVSPRLYEATLRALEMTEREPQDELPPLKFKTTYPWKNVKESDDVPKWVNVETGKVSFDAPLEVWERKLLSLEGLRKVGHVERRPTTLDAAEEATLREDRRLDATVYGWEKEEEEKEARRRRYAQREKEKRLAHQRQKRLTEPNEIDDVADALISIVRSVEHRAEMEMKREKRDQRRQDRLTWHPACGARNLRPFRRDNCVDLDYVDLYLTTDGAAYATKRSSVQQEEETPQSDDRHWLSKKVALLPPLPSIDTVVDKIAALTEKKKKTGNARKLNREMRCRLRSRRRGLDKRMRLLDALSVDPVPASSPDTQTARLELDLALVVPPLCAKIEDKDRIRLDATPRRKFQDHLRDDVAKAIGTTTDHVLIDEVTTLRQRSPWSPTTTHHKSDRRTLGWTPAPHDNLVQVKLTLLKVDPSQLDKARGISNASQKERYKILCCAVGGSVRPTDVEFRDRSWPQYWVYAVSPVFFGRRTQLPSAAAKTTMTPPEDAPLEEDALAPPALSDRRARYRIEVKRAQAAVEALTKHKQVYGFDGQQKLTPEQLAAIRKLERSELRCRAAKRLEAVKSDRHRHREVPEWWQRARPPQQRKTPPPKEKQQHDSDDSEDDDDDSKSGTRLLRAKLAARRSAARQRRAHQERYKQWRVQKLVVQNWFLRKVAAAYAASVANHKHQNEESPTDAVLGVMARLNLERCRDAGKVVDAGNRNQCRKIEAALRKVHHDVNDDVAFEAIAGSAAAVRKRDLYTALCEPPLMDWALASESQAFFRTLQTSDLAAKAFLTSPVARNGYVTAEELVIFGLVLHEWLPIYHDAVSELHAKHHDDQSSSQGNSSSFSKKKKKKKDNDASIGEEEITIPEEDDEISEDEMDDPGFLGAPEAETEGRKEDEWSMGHTHIFVRCEGRSFCCICRRRRYESFERRAKDIEARFTGKWARRRERRLDAAMPLIERNVASQRRTERHQMTARHKVALAVYDLVDKVEQCDAITRVTDTVVKALVDTICGGASNLLVQYYQGNNEDSVVDDVQGRLPTTVVEVGVVDAGGRNDDAVLGTARVPWRLLKDPPLAPVQVPLRRKEGYVGSTVTFSSRLNDDDHGAAYLCILRASDLPEGTKPYGVVTVDGVDVGRTVPRWQLTDGQAVWADPLNVEDSDDDSDDANDLDYIKVTSHQKRTSSRLGFLRSAATEVARCRRVVKCIEDLLVDKEGALENERTKHGARMDAEETERRAMAAEEWRSRSSVEALRRSSEDAAKRLQEKGHLAFQGIRDDVADRGAGPVQAGLMRLRFMETLRLENTHAVFSCVDPSRGHRVVLNLLFLHHADDVAEALENAEAVRCCRSRSIVSILGVYDHVVERYNGAGVAHQKFHLVAIVSKDHSNGRLIDHLSLKRVNHRRHAAHVRLFPGLATSSLEMTPANVQRWAADVAHGLAILHRRNVLHRNLHPGAVFIDDTGHAVLDDFLFESSPRAPGCVSSWGRNDYGGSSQDIIAPELMGIPGVGIVSAKADSWAFGCCVYFWCCGSLPNCHRHSLTDLLDLVPTIYDRSLRIAIEFALQPDPHARASADQLVRILVEAP